MTINDSDDQKKSNQFSDEIISPMFGYDYKNRIVSSKNNNKNTKTTEEINYLKKQMEKELEEQSKLTKVKEYHNQEENQNFKDALDSNHLNFHDSLGNSSDDSIISVFDSTTSISDNTISEIIDDLLNEEPN